MRKGRLWVLGAADPEMVAIEKLLRDAGERFVYAMCEGKRVHPGNAYKSDDVSEETVCWGDATHVVECHCPKIYPKVLAERLGRSEVVRPDVVRIDHHRPGDPGYGKPGEKFLEASSIGQTIALLAKMANGKDAEIFPTWPIVAVLGVYPIGTFGHDMVVVADQGEIGKGVPDEILMAAAADHCLETAYRGKCPGISPDALMQWRVETRAAFQQRPVADVLRDVEQARKTLIDAPMLDCGPDPSVQLYTRETDPEGSWPQNAFHGQLTVRDLRGQQIPELPEAAAREGIPFLSTVRDPSGREKVVLQAASAELVQKFLAGTLVEGLTDLYGDPARGFAGGYVKSH
ncbi:MAG: hypothetical protein HYZ63_03940 [Candidatus Andersenbacteria bacterium]|nr:hypothetical protein [Candidatus Andersenbacteria bacterium]